MSNPRSHTAADFQLLIFYLSDGIIWMLISNLIAEEFSQFCNWITLNLIKYKPGIACLRISDFGFSSSTTPAVSHKCQFNFKLHCFLDHGIIEKQGIRAPSIIFSEASIFQQVLLWGTLSCQKYVILNKHKESAWWTFHPIEGSIQQEASEVYLEQRYWPSIVPSQLFKSYITGVDIN